MSLSDTQTNGFKPLSIHSLESFDDELTHSDGESEPDFDRFKLLIEKPAFGKGETAGFEALYKESETDEEVIFKPLVDSKEVDAPGPEAAPEPVVDQEAAGEPIPGEVEVEAAEEKKGFAKGFEQGLEAGEKKGYEDGLEKGLRQGEEQGAAQGQEQGFEQGHQQGLEQGLEEGRAKGMEEAAQSASEILGSLKVALEKADRVLEDLVDKYEDRLVSLVGQIAEKTVMARIEMDDEAVRPLVVDALKNLVDPEDVVLSVSPRDYEYIEMVKDQFFDEIESLTRVSVRSDPGVSRGGCKIETRTASVSTDIESRLQAIFEAVKEAGG